MTKGTQKETKRGLLSIGEACHMLGVSEVTLRQWTDEGKVKAFVTPGGHRRYPEAELRHLLGLHRRTRGLRELGDRLQGMVSEHREVALQYMRSAHWYHRMDETARERLRERGRRLVGVLVQFVTRPATRKRAVDECRSIGAEYGEDLASLGLSLTDSLEAFILHRNPVSQATTELLSSSVPLNRRALAAVPEIHRLIDETLLSLVHAHQRVSGRQGGQSLNGGATS
jgi:excisionase family DNA binding protein